jgi:hypothetical protein
LLAGVVNATDTVDVLNAEAVPIVGAPGSVVGVTLLLGALSAPVPYELVAFTVKVYAVPAVNPITVIGLVVPVLIIPLGELVAV